MSDKSELFSEFESLCNQLEEHLNESSEYSAALYQVVCELGKNQFKHSLAKTGMNQVREEMLILAGLFAKTKKQVKTIKNLVELEKGKNDA